MTPKLLAEHFRSEVRDRRDECDQIISLYDNQIIRFFGGDGEIPEESLANIIAQSEDTEDFDAKVDAFLQYDEDESFDSEFSIPLPDDPEISEAVETAFSSGLMDSLSGIAFGKLRLKSTYRPLISGLRHLGISSRAAKKLASAIRGWAVSNVEPNP